MSNSVSIQHDARSDGHKLSKSLKTNEGFQVSSDGGPPVQYKGIYLISELHVRGFLKANDKAVAEFLFLDALLPGTHASG